MTQTPKSALELYFEPFRRNIIGLDQEFETPYGRKKIVYADWTASGRMYAPIEKILTEKISPFAAASDHFPNHKRPFLRSSVKT